MEGKKGGRRNEQVLGRDGGEENGFIEKMRKWGREFDIYRERGEEARRKMQFERHVFP